MAKLPSFQFYPGDWLKDPDLRICSLAAKGLLIDMLCYMHESQERGVLLVRESLYPTYISPGSLVVETLVKPWQSS